MKAEIQEKSSVFINFYQDSQKLGEKQREDSFRSLFGSNKNSKFYFYYLNDPIPKDMPRLLIGVATWSKLDMEFLDSLELKWHGQKRLWIDIFSTYVCKKQRDFEDFIPDIEQVFQTPVVGYWENGNLKQCATGAKARELAFREIK